MGLFDIFKSKKVALKLFAPIDGYIVKLEDTPDEVFSQRIVGDGVAINPTGLTIVAPCAGTVAKIFRTNHAFSMETPEGVELFVHFGMNTIELEGQGFERLIEEGESVKMGTPVLKLDLEFLKEKAESIITPVVVSNVDEWDVVNIGAGAVKAGETLILEARRKR